MLRFFEDSVICDGDGEEYTKEKNVKAKIRFVKFEKALAMQVLEMDERFRKISESFICSIHNTDSGFFVKSLNTPFMTDESIYLWGIRHLTDYRIVTRTFHDNFERDEYLEKAISALKDWAGNWEGFLENPGSVTISNDSEDDFVLEV